MARYFAAQLMVLDDYLLGKGLDDCLDQHVCLQWSREDDFLGLDLDGRLVPLVLDDGLRSWDPADCRLPPKCDPCLLEDLPSSSALPG